MKIKIKLTLPDAGSASLCVSESISLLRKVPNFELSSTHTCHVITHKASV